MLTAIILIADHIMYKHGRDTGLYAAVIITLLLDFMLVAIMFGPR